MLKVKETTATEVYAHALDHGDKPVIHGAEIDYDDVHDGVRYHADLLDAARQLAAAALADAEKARYELERAAMTLAIAVDLAEEGGRSPRSFATYRDDLAAYRAARTASKAAYSALEAAVDRRKELQAKAAQEAASATSAEPVVTPPKPGDLCRILGDSEVEHWGCDEHPDGVITDSRTGKVVSA